MIPTLIAAAVFERYERELAIYNIRKAAAEQMRERAAKIADAYADPADVDSILCEKIAAAIRSLPTEE